MYKEQIYRPVIRVCCQSYSYLHQLFRSILFCCLFVPALLLAGGSPETTLLVVNADSPLSLTVANHYVQLRQIPENHVVWVHDIPSLGSITMQTFRDHIWSPIRRFMELQGLSDHIDTIVYSADFPYAVKLKKDLKKNKIPSHKFIGGYASLTGLTYFARQVENQRMDYLTLYPNGYYRRDLSRNITTARNMKSDEKKQLAKARTNLRRRKYQLAHDIYLSLSKKYPKQAFLVLGLAESQSGLKKWDVALKSLKRLEEMDFRNGLLLRNSRHLKGLHKTKEFRHIIQQMEMPSSRFELPHGFHSRYHWARNSMAFSLSSTDRYYLSSMLAYTGQRGNSLDEIKHYLDRSVSSDASRPDGTVYLMENRDIRAEARQPWFSETCELLGQIGRKCEILSPGNGSKRGILPRNRDDIIGLVAGTRNFDWTASGNRLLPGAIADSFTSYSGDFNRRKQTKLTEFLRQGAAGSSGAVTEPYSIPEKFPLPLIHYYYASGCSMAESWYQSVASPYQMILVGDPITRPFVQFADMELLNPDPQQAWSGKVQIKTMVKPKEDGRIARIELWVDGVPVTHSTPGNPIIWDTTTVDDGYHDIRLVAEEEGLIGTRTYIRHNVLVYNHNSGLTIQAEYQNPLFHEPITLTGNGEGNSLITIYQGRRKLGETKMDNGRWSAQIPTETLGMGVVHITAVGTTTDGRQVRSEPIRLEIRPPNPIPSVTEHTSNYPGLVAAIKYKDRTTEQKRVKQLNGRVKILSRNTPPVESIQIDGEFQVERTGFYQVIISTRGKIDLTIDEMQFSMATPKKKYGLIYVPISLDQGWHRISIKPSLIGMGKLTMLLSGGQAPALLAGDRIRNNIPLEESAGDTSK